MVVFHESYLDRMAFALQDALQDLSKARSARTAFAGGVLALSVLGFGGDAYQKGHKHQDYSFAIGQGLLCLIGLGGILKQQAGAVPNCEARVELAQGRLTGEMELFAAYVASGDSDAEDRKLFRRFLRMGYIPEEEGYSALRDSTNNPFNMNFETRRESLE